MPLVRIDLVKGRTEARVRAVADAVHAAVVEVLAVPERDRFQIITEHEVAARGSGDRQVFWPNLKSIDWKVPLLIGSAWNRYS